MQSLVVADIGSALTKTALLCRVEGSLRLVASSQAPTSIVAPRADVRQGIREGVAMLEATTGRRLLDDDFLLSPAQTDGNGVDYFLATSSTGEVLTLLVLVADARSPEAIRFVDAAPRHFTAPARLDVFNLAGGRPARAQLVHWQLTPLDAVVFVPAAKSPKEAADRATELAQFLASTSKRKGLNRLPLFFVGTQHQLDSLGLVPSEDLAWQSLASDVDPSVDPLAALAAHLNALYQDRQQRFVPGLEGLGQFLAAPLQTGPQSLGVAADFLAKTRDAYALVVDVGSATVAAVSSNRQTLEWGSAPGKGVGSGAPGVVAAAGAASIMRWLPYQLTPAQVDDAAMNRALFPWAMPATREDLQFDHALAVEAIRLALGPRDRKAAHAALDLVVAAGGLFRGTPEPGQVVLSLLNALEPVGRTSMVLDRYGILQPAAVLSQHEPALVQDLLGTDGLEPLGTCIGLAGKAKDGEPALHVKMLDGPEAGRDFTVAAGTIHVLPVGAGQAVSLELRPLGRLSLGLRPGEGVRAERLQGGSVGVVLDARPRPLVLPASASERAAKVASWMEAFHAY